MDKEDTKPIVKNDIQELRTIHIEIGLNESEIKELLDDIIDHVPTQEHARRLIDHMTQYSNCRFDTDIVVNSKPKKKK